jgi:ribosomal protein S18 acetylase RimI-like enzyme
MSDEIIPFGGQHLNDAASLLAARHRAARARVPELPERFEQPAEVRPLIEQTLAIERAFGVAALRGGRLVGYLIGREALETSFFRRPRAAAVDLAGHAVDAEDGGEAYRALYAALASRWIEEGYFAHEVAVPAVDDQALAAWFSLGFGQGGARGIRSLAPLPNTESVEGIEVHRAGVEDAEPAARLQRQLALHHTGSPIFVPLPPESDGEFRRLTAERLSDPEHRTFLAVRGGEALGMIALAPPDPRSALVTPERCIHIDDAYTEAALRGSGVGRLLLETAMAQAREDGYQWCSVSWMTANIPAQRFWRAVGFQPTLYRLVREVDSRIAWARPDP